MSSVTTDNDAAGLVRIHDCPNPPDSIHGGNQGRGELCRRQRRYQSCNDNKCPNPPGDDTTQKPVEKKTAVPTDNDAETPAARAQIRNNNE